MQTYSRQLAAQEAQLATLRDKVAQLQQARTALGDAAQHADRAHGVLKATAFLRSS